MTQQQKEQISKLRATGASFGKIASALGISINTVKSYCKRNPISSEPMPAPKAVVHPDRCPQCNALLEQSPGHRQKRFCSPKCRIAWWAAHQEQMTRKKLFSVECQHCGGVFIQDLREAIDSGHHSYDSAKEIKSVLKNLFKLAAADGRASASLPGFIILPEHEEKEVEPFNADEVKALEKLWDNGHLFAGYIILMIYTGMMPGELLGLKKPMILLDEKVIRGAGLKTKRRKKLDIVLADFLIPIIQKLMEQSNTDKFIRINEMNFYAKYYETLEMAGTKRRTPYACRHSTATALALHSDIPPAVISRILRHSAQMTEHYTHPDNTEALKAVNKLKPEEQKSAGA